MQRSKEIANSGSRTYRFIPTKGPLHELSGHIGDACWASKYDSIAEAFPNFTSVIFVQNPESSSRRLAGACLLIETTSSDGEPLLVIRGVNPLQNVITQLDSKSFMNELTDYVEEIATTLGRKPAIVIDDHSGGSATNRPSLYDYMVSVRPQLQQVQLASADDTTFNNYNIVRNTYLL